MAYNPKIGHHVIVADKANAYNGQEVVVSSIRGNVFTVKAGSISFALTRSQLREVKYGD